MSVGPDDKQHMILSAWLGKISLAEAPTDQHLNALKEVLHTAAETGIIDHYLNVQDYITLVKLGVLASKLDPDEVRLIKM